MFDLSDRVASDLQAADTIGRLHLVPPYRQSIPQGEIRKKQRRMSRDGTVVQQYANIWLKGEVRTFGGQIREKYRTLGKSF